MQKRKMEKIIFNASFMIIGLLVYTKYAECSTTSTSAATSSKETTTPASTQASSTQTSQASTQTTSTVSQAAAAASQRSAAIACPDGQYNQRSNTVTFTMDDKECQITVYLSKPPKGKKAKKAKKTKKAKKAKKDKKGKGKGKESAREEVQQGQRFIEKEVALGPIPGKESDQCPEVVVTKSGKENFVLQTSECIMYVQKPKKKGKGRSSTPIIMTDEVRP